jgi:hypothetical protein
MVNESTKILHLISFNSDLLNPNWFMLLTVSRETALPSPETMQSILEKKRELTITWTRGLPIFINTTSAPRWVRDTRVATQDNLSPTNLFLTFTKSVGVMAGRCTISLKKFSIHHPLSRKVSVNGSPTLTKKFWHYILRKSSVSSYGFESRQRQLQTTDIGL